MPFIDSDKYLVPVMIAMIGQSYGRKTYDFEMARQCSKHAGHMAEIGHCFHADPGLLGSACAENVAHETVIYGNFISAVEKIIISFMNSEGHRKNMEKHPVIGIGTAVRFEHEKEPVLYVAQRFRH